MCDHRDARNEEHRSSGKWRSWIIGIAMSLVLLAGLWTARQSGETVDLQMRRELVRQVTAVAATIDPAQIKTLSFTAEDATRPVFRILSSQMAAYAESAKLPCLYTLALRDRKLIAGPGTSSSALPGTVQQNPGPKDMEVFVTARPQVLGPDGDEDGTFVRALAPVIHPSTGEVLMAVCADVKADAWRTFVRKAQWGPGGITLVLLLFLLLSELIFRYPHYAGLLRSGYMETALCAIFLTGLSLVAATYFHRLERDMRRNTFYSLAQERAAASVAEFNNLNSMLDQLGCFFEARNTISRDEFGIYCKNIMQSGVMQRCLWIPAVPDAEVPAFIQTVRGTGITNFFIWQKTSDGGREPASRRSVYYPVLYTEPSGTGLVLGYDECSEPTRGDAIRRALDRGLSMATDPVRLTTSTNPALAVLIFKPVNSAANKGMAALAVYPDTLLGSSSRRTGRRNDLDICLSQLEFGKPRLLMAGSSDQCVRECWADLKPELNMDVPVFRFGKTYVLRLVPEPSWLAAHPLHGGWQVGGLGMLFTLLASSLVALITNRQRVLEKNVNLRTAELKASEVKFRAIIECSPVPMMLNDAQQNITFMNHAFIQTFGYTPKDIPTLSDWGPQVYPDPKYRQWVAEDWQSRLARAKQTGEAFQPIEVQVTCKNRTVKTILVTATWFAGSFEDSHLVVFHDITARKQAEEAVQTGLERQRQFVQHLETVREEERKRISRELHDDIGQILTALKIDLVLVDSECSCHEGVRSNMRDMQKLLSDGIQSVHSLCRRLRPGALDDLSLQDALEGLIDDWQKRNRIECEINADVTDGKLSEAIKTTVFRIVQEALTNVSRYAHASKVDIHLVDDEESLTVSFSDNGCGMEPGSAEKPTSFGLMGMRERIESLGGTLHIESEPGQGTRIEAIIPLVFTPPPRG